MISPLSAFPTFFALSLLILCNPSAISQEKVNPLHSLRSQEKNITPLPLSGLSTLEWKQNADKGHFASIMKLAKFWMAKLDKEKQKTPQAQEAYHWAVHWLKKASESAHPAPQYHLMKLKYSEWAPDGSEASSSFDELKDIADSCQIRATQGDIEAILVLMDYVDEPDQQQFDHWVYPIRKKANSGDGQAQADLARLLFMLPEFQKIDSEALILAQQAATQDNPDGMYLAGRIMLSPVNELRVKEEGISMLINAAQAGHIEALAFFASPNLSLESVNILPWDHKKMGIIQMLCSRGQLDFLIQRGIELVEKNIDAPGGLSMLSRAADQGSFTALDLLSKYYQNNDYNVPEDPVKSVAYASRLICHNGVNGFLKMASYYERGFGVEKNEKKAFEYAHQAMQMNVPEAYVVYARLLIKGIGTVANPREAFSLLGKLEKESPQTPSLQFLLGYMSEEGLGTNKDFHVAFSHYMKGALSGDTRAMNNLASMYELGSGTPKNIQKAVEWYLKAAQNGNLEAQRNMKKINHPLNKSPQKQ